MSRPTFIETDRLELCPPDEDDIDFLREGVNHPRVREHIAVFREPYTEERYRDELWGVDADSPTMLAVPKSGERAGDPVGSVQLYPVNETDGSANLGVWLHPTAWGNGYATEASAHLLDYGFGDLRLHRISASVMGGNDASRRLCERLGFTHEGTTREAQFANGDYRDTERYGLLRNEWGGPEGVLD